MIAQVYVLDSNRNMVGILDGCESVIWKVEYYGTGDFEVYTTATDDALQYLVKGNYIVRTDRDEIGVIEKVDIAFEQQSGLMITASGRFAKSLLDRRLIYNLSGNTITPVISSGNLETAVRNLVNISIVNPTDSNRQISYIKLGEVFGITDVIVSESGQDADKQTSYQNLLDYTDKLLHQYQCGARMRMGAQNNLLYEVYKGADRSVGNTSGNSPIIFSQEFDNLLSSNFSTSDQNLKNWALIGGEGEGIARFYTTIGSTSGDARREVFINASDQSRKQEVDGQEVEFTDEEYTQMLETAGMQKIAEYITITSFKGAVDVTHSPFKYGIDYNVGDRVTVQDNQIGVLINSRVIKATEVQDDNGYSINIEFEE